MKRRGFCDSLLIAITLAFLGSVFWLTFISRDLTGILVACGAYAAILGFFGIFAKLSVLRCRQDTPPMPREFETLSLGEITPAIRNILKTAVSREERASRGIEHSLFRLIQQSSIGVWICEVETAQDSIIALRKKFESSASQLFDHGFQMGEGIFIYTQTTDG
jgi:hypothetical protein